MLEEINYDGHDERDTAPATFGEVFANPRIEGPRWLRVLQEKKVGLREPHRTTFRLVCVQATEEEFRASQAAQAAAVALLPVLTGSPRQFLWALDIRRRALHAIDQAAQSYPKAAQAVRRALLRRTSAKWWIEARDSLSDLALSICRDVEAGLPPLPPNASNQRWSRLEACRESAGGQIRRRYFLGLPAAAWGKPVSIPAQMNNAAEFIDLLATNKAEVTAPLSDEDREAIAALAARAKIGGDYVLLDRAGAMARGDSPITVEDRAAAAKTIAKWAAIADGTWVKPDPRANVAGRAPPA